MLGVVSACYPDLGIAIKFKESLIVDLRFAVTLGARNESKRIDHPIA